MTLLQTGKILVPVHSYKGPVNLYNGSTLSEDLKDIVDEKAITVGAFPSLISSTLITKIWNKNELPQALLSKRRSWRELTDSTKKQLIDHVQQNHDRAMFNRCNPYVWRDLEKSYPHLIVRLSEFGRGLERSEDPTLSNIPPAAPQESSWRGTMSKQSLTPGQWYEGEYTLGVPDSRGECLFYASQGSKRLCDKEEFHAGGPGRDKKEIEQRLGRRLVDRGEVTCRDGVEHISLGNCRHPACYGRIDALNRLTYIGQWKGGIREGQGKMTWKDGDVYVGGFKTNAKEGQGTYTWSNGASYHGQWLTGKRNGKGVCSYPDGSCFEGKYIDDLRHGLGKVTFPNGDTLEGKWSST